MSNKTVNNTVKALLIGFIAGALAGLIGTDYGFYPLSGHRNAMDFYNWYLFVFTGVVTSGLLFLRYNSKEG